MNSHINQQSLIFLKKETKNTKILVYVPGIEWIFLIKSHEMLK